MGKEQLTKSASDLEELKEKNNKEAVTEVQSSVRSKLSKAFPQVDAKDFDEFVNAEAESASKSADSEEVEKLQQELGEAKEAESRLANQMQALQSSYDGALQRNKILEADLNDREETIVAKENAADSYSLILQSAEADMKRIQEEATTQHEQNSEKLKNAEEKVASLEKQLDAANKTLEDKDATISTVSQEKTEQHQADIDSGDSRSTSSPVQVPEDPICMSEDQQSGFMVVDHAAPEDQQTEEVAQSE